MSEPKFEAENFLRRLEAGEFDEDIRGEIEKLTESELEELALIVVGQLRVKAAGAC